MALQSYLPRTKIAYFSMEISLAPGMNTYAGGLGILAGDVARSAADLQLPMVFVTMASRQGYLLQSLDDNGNQIDAPDPWDLAAFAAPLAAMVAIELEGRQVWIRPWLYEVCSTLGSSVPVILLDTNVEQNGGADRVITDRLYGGANSDRLRQEAVLGLGGEQILRALGFSIETYHLNEGHAAFAAVALLRRTFRNNGGSEGAAYDVEAVREQCVFTTHTPVEAGHDRFAYAEVERVLGPVIETGQLRALGGPDVLNMTRLALNLSGYVNGVARKHAETARQMFPGYRVNAITNGVHVDHWANPALRKLFASIAPQCCHEPETLARADRLDDKEVWAAHRLAKKELADEVFRRCGVRLALDQPVITFARRMTSYKRPDLLFSDLDRLRLVHEKYPFQIVVSGKAHPRDDGGRQLIRRIVEISAQMQGRVPVVFVPNYDIPLAKMLVAGSDVWLNTPVPPLEASGTSGMKAALNGVLNLSILDGWWLEAWEEGITGWAIDSPQGAESGKHPSELLYRKLEDVVLPLYHQDRSRWTWMMKQAISRIGPVFNSQHMMRRYASEAYLR